MAKKSRGDIGIFERYKPGEWYVRYRDELGRDRWKLAGTKSSAKALRTRLLEEVRQRKLRLKLGRREEERLNLTLSDLLERYRPKYEAKKGRVAYRGYIKKWKRDLGDLLAGEVVPDDIERWQRSQRARGMKNATVNRHTSFLRAIFNLGIRDRLLDFNPLEKGRVEKLEERGPRERVLTYEEEAILLPELEPVDRAAFLLSLYAGLRQGEVLKLERTDINLQARLATLRDTKAGKTQVIELCSVALEAAIFAMSQHDHALLFPGKGGQGSMSGPRLTERLKRAAEKLGLEDVLWHTTRHTFVTRLIANGHNAGTVKELARHSCLTMTNEYLHPTRSLNLQALESLCRPLSGAGPLLPKPAAERRHLRAL